jgi:hypothetical protein
MKAAKWDIRRGRHKKRASRETQEWNDEFLIPECPPWMDRDTYLELMKLRAEKEKP